MTRSYTEVIDVLDRLAQAGACRDNTQGDPIRLLEVQAELREAVREAREVVHEYRRTPCTS